MLSWGVCVCVWGGGAPVYVCQYTCVGIHIHMCACNVKTRGWPHVSCPGPPSVFFREDFHNGLLLINQAKLVVSESQEPSWCPLPGTGIINLAIIFMWAPGDRTHVPVLTRLVLYQLSHTCSSSAIFFMGIDSE